MNVEFLEWTVVVVDLASVAIMMIGFVYAIFRFIPTLWQETGAAAIDAIRLIRCGLGTYLVFALELMIISDLINSVMSHRLEDLYFLAGIVVLRTVIAYFLNREIHELKGA